MQSLKDIEFWTSHPRCLCNVHPTNNTFSIPRLLRFYPENFERVLGKDATYIPIPRAPAEYDKSPRNKVIPLLKVERSWDLDTIIRDAYDSNGNINIGLRTADGDIVGDSTMITEEGNIDIVGELFKVFYPGEDVWIHLGQPEIIPGTVTVYTIEGNWGENDLRDPVNTTTDYEIDYSRGRIKPGDSFQEDGVYLINYECSGVRDNIANIIMRMAEKGGLGRLYLNKPWLDNYSSYQVHHDDISWNIASGQPSYPYLSMSLTEGVPAIVEELLEQE